MEKQWWVTARVLLCTTQGSNPAIKLPDTEQVTFYTKVNE